jgi:phage terminase large subunit GpA-like protein
MPRCSWWLVSTCSATVEVGVYAFGPGEETWTVAHEMIPGAPKLAKTWGDLDELLAKRVKRGDG